MNHCRKSSKAYSKKCSFLIATCTAQGFFPKCEVSAYLENCCLVTFLEQSEISVSTIDFWECNGFGLVGFGVNGINKLTATFRLDQRRINRGITKQITVIQ